jgi:putative ABC transport system permease protein
MIKYAIKEIFRKWKWSLIFCLNLSFGFIGFISLLSFQNSIEEKVLLNSKQILSADLSVNARKKIPATEIDKVKKVINELKIEIQAESYFIEFLAMLKTESKSQIVSVKAIDSNYPLYGDLELLWRNDKFSLSRDVIQGNKFIAYSELKEMLALQKQQKVTLGKLELSVEDFVSKDTTQTFKFGGIAPKVFIDQALLNKSGLLEFGSTFTESYLFKLKEPYNKELLLSELNKVISDPVIQVETSETAAKDSARQLGFLTDFLNLIAIISILLSALGTNFLYQVFIYKKIKDYAIFKSLGLDKISLRKIFSYQIFILSFFIILLSYIGAQLFIPILTYFFEKTLSIYLTVTIPTSVVGLSFLIIVLTCFMVAIPFLFSLEKLSTAKLFSEEKMNLNISFRARLPQLLSIFLIGMLSFYLTKSINLSGIFLAALVGITFISVGLAFLGIKSLELFHFKNWILKYSFKSIIRKKSSSIIIFCCITLSSLLLNILPQVKNSIKKEFIYSDNVNLPAMFILDIQEEQVESLKSILKKQNKQLDHLSPLIRARIIKVNDMPFERKLNNGSFTTREEEREARFRNRGVNLTYRHEITKTEDIVEGIPFTKYKSEMPGLSIEYKYAERLGFKLDDILTFDIQGVEISAKVINFRKVRWISFQPNFFISFDEGVLNEAPKSFIGIVNNVDTLTTNKLISEISNSLPNLSILDVRQLVKDVLSIADQMAFSIQLMSFLTMITGFVILASIIYLQLHERRWEMNFLKILGANFWSMLAYVIIEFNLITFMASMLGIILSFIFSYTLIKVLFETPFSFEISSSIILIMSISLISFLLCFLVSYRILKEPSSTILKDS